MLICTHTMEKIKVTTYEKKQLKHINNNTVYNTDSAFLVLKDLQWAVDSILCYKNITVKIEQFNQIFNFCYFRQQKNSNFKN